MNDKTIGIKNLISKLEKAKEGNTSLDQEIALLIKSTEEPTPPFTSSIDAARIVVPNPPGSLSLATTFIVGGFKDNRPHGAWAEVFYNTAMAGSPYDPPPYEGSATSMALALCIAALKARAE